MISRSDVIDLPGSGRMSRSGTRLVLAARALRAFADGFVAVLLPAYLLALGHGQLEVGFLSTATLVGSAIATLAVGRWGHRFAIRRLLLGAAVLMAATGLGFAALSSLWPLLIVAFMGTLNPSGGDVSVFLPLEHTVLAAPRRGRAHQRVRALQLHRLDLRRGRRARGAVPEWLASAPAGRCSMRCARCSWLYAAIGVAVWLLYLRLPSRREPRRTPPAPLGPSRGIV